MKRRVYSDETSSMFPVRLFLDLRSFLAVAEPECSIGPSPTKSEPSAIGWRLDLGGGVFVFGNEKREPR